MTHTLTKSEQEAAPPVVQDVHQLIAAVDEATTKTEIASTEKALAVALLQKQGQKKSQLDRKEGTRRFIVGDVLFEVSHANGCMWAPCTDLG